MCSSIGHKAQSSPPQGVEGDAAWKRGFPVGPCQSPSLRRAGPWLCRWLGAASCPGPGGFLSFSAPRRGLQPRRRERGAQHSRWRCCPLLCKRLLGFTMSDPALLEPEDAEPEPTALGSRGNTGSGRGSSSRSARVPELLTASVTAGAKAGVEGQQRSTPAMRCLMLRCRSEVPETRAAPRWRLEARPSRSQTQKQAALPPAGSRSRRR